MLLAFLMMQGLMAQTHCYWVLLTDKQGTHFDPYAYFDAKAIERYRQCGADLYDISNFPVNSSYESQVSALAAEDLGVSRWLNAVAVMATPDQVAEIRNLACVSDVRMVGGEWQLAQVPAVEEKEDNGPTVPGGGLFDQLIRMGGQQFKDKGYDGKGVRVAVFDGGFPHVDTHDAFKHLRDNHQIVKTWNFPDKKENVYLAGSHGTMTLSCIAGRLNDSQLGLATGAEFLLARTEINTEPFKEEVWWMQAMEWADKNGAKVISSSLGYGKERHYTYEMDGRSYVAKAANMAARKGMLVCNSAGNEGDDRRWKTIITPADADSVLCVAGIEDDLTSYRHISFSSYGPGADGRLKPNVCAFGHAVVANHSKDHALTTAYGTSFSCPLVSGFVACAWQAHPELTAMQMMQEVEKSADLYPYYDYALGYGVPQASYFVEGAKQVEPTFKIEERDFYVAVIPLKKHEEKVAAKKFVEADTTVVVPNEVNIKPTFFFKAEDKNGRIENYYSLEFDNVDPNTMIVFRKGAIFRSTLVVSYQGYTESFRLSDAVIRKLMEDGAQEDFSYAVTDTSLYLMANYEENMSRSPEDNRVNEKAWGAECAFNFGLSLLPQLNAEFTPLSYHTDYAVRFTKPLAKRYALGLGLLCHSDYYGFDSTMVNDIDNLLGVSSAQKKYLSQTELDVEFFQRVTLIPGGALTHHGLHWDLGLWAGVRIANDYVVQTEKVQNADLMTTEYSNVHYAGFNRFVFGATTRLTWDAIGLYASYRMSDLLLKDTDLKLPALRVGLTVEL